MRRKLILALGLLIVLAVVVFVWLFVASTSRQALRARLSEVTGGVVQLHSAERLWWAPGVVLHGLAVETEGFTLDIDRLEVRVAFLPLLWGEARPREVSLSDARLTVKEGETRLPDLPWEAAWEVHRLDLYGPVRKEEKQLLHVREASLVTGLDATTRLEILAGASAEAPISVQIEGEASGWRKRTLPRVKLALNLDNLPAQPLTGYLSKDERVLARARLDGLLNLATQEDTLIAEGRLRAESASDEQLLELQFRAQASREGVVLDTASGTVAGNQMQANGTGRFREDGEWKVDLKASLADGRINDDTVRLLHEALGREVLGFADHLRGRFTAEMDLTASPEQERMAGQVDLQGMTYAAPGLPPVFDLKGRLNVDAPAVQFVGVSATAFDVPIRLQGSIRGRQIALQVETDDIPLAALPLPPEEGLQLENLMGTASATVDVNGDMENPQVSGVVRLQDAGFDFGRAPVRGIGGEALFSLERAEFDALAGRAGGCPFLVSGELVPTDWQATAQVSLEVPGCELSELLELAQQAAVFSIPLLKPEELAGSGSISAEYRNQQWRGRLEVRNGNWKPAWLELPVEAIAARISAEPAGIELEQLQGTLGISPVSLAGRIDLFQAVPGWQLELRTALQPLDAERLLHGRGPQWLHFRGVVTGTARLSGSADAGVRMRAAFQLPVMVGGDSGEESASPYLDEPPQLQLQGVWQDGVFALDEFTSTVGATRLAGEGRVRLSPERHLHLRVQAPPGSSVSDLLTLVRLPEAVGQPGGHLSADIAVVGPPDNLEWSGVVSLDEVHLPELLTEPVSLSGRLELGREGVEVRDLEIRQPNGMFTMAGLLRPRGRSDLTLRGAWANLDRLLGQFPEGGFSVPPSQFLARHPLRIAIDIDRVQFLGLVFDRVEGELEQSDSRFILRVPRFGVASGVGSVEVTPVPGTNHVHARLNLEEVRAATLLEEVLKRPAPVGGPLSAQADLTGPLGSQDNFLQAAEGEVRFALGEGRLRRGTLPERLFALAVLLREGLYGFGLSWLTRIGKPHDLDRFQEWTGTVRLENGTVHIEETELISKVYNVTMTGEMVLESSRLRIHGEGNFHPGWEFDISLKAAAGLFSRLFRLARGRRGHDFEFDVSGTLGGRKSVENFRFKD